jgi:hypothetical protein
MKKGNAKTLKRKKVESDSEEETKPTKTARTEEYKPLSKEELSVDFLLTTSEIRKGVAKQSFWKGLNYYCDGVPKILGETVKKNQMVTITGECQGTQSEPYQQEVTIRLPSHSESVDTKDWVGKCDCDNARNKGNVCSHQVAVLLEWVEDKSLNTFQTIKVSEKERIKKAPKKLPISKADSAAITKNKKKLQDNSIKGLKDMCKHNNMVQSGNKDELIEKIASSMVLGVIPKCPTCGGGRPKYQNGFWFCEGYRDDTDWTDCCFVGTDITRVVWADEEI